LLLDNALATMGAGLPSAMAVALLNPERKVLAVVGDGGFMMNSQVGGAFYLYLCCNMSNIVHIYQVDMYFRKWTEKGAGGWLAVAA
jgi:thiamine pyrophosphate-dependent acetolactate synthase large subunit-like protein